MLLGLYKDSGTERYLAAKKASAKQTASIPICSGEEISEKGWLSYSSPWQLTWLLWPSYLFCPGQGDFTPKRLYRTDTNTDDQVEQLGIITMLLLDVKHSIFGVPDSGSAPVDEEAASAVSGETSGQEPAQKEYPYNALDIDFSALKENASSSDSEWLSEYFDSLTPTRQNEYTGMFEGYNVIFITAEGFSGYMIDPELTPTLYRLSHEGFVLIIFILHCTLQVLPAVSSRTLPACIRKQDFRSA